VQNEVSITVNGLKYTGWQTVNIKRTMEAISGSFSLTATSIPDEYESIPTIKPGSKSSVFIGTDIVLTGYIDEIFVNYDSHNHNITINGRDKSADLVDCSVTNTPGSWSNQTITQIAKELLSPFGIPVEEKVTVNTIESHSADQGETVFECLEKAARKTGVLLVSDGEGGIVITRVGNQRASESLEQGKNIKSLSAKFSHKDRFSRYIIKGLKTGNDEQWGEKTNQFAEVSDSAIKRFRPLIINAETQVDEKSCQDRANWEKTVREARSSKITVAVQGWRQKDGRLWKPNLLTNISSPWANLDNDMLISAVTFSKDHNGTVTILELTNPSAYKLQSTSNTSNTKDLGW